MSNSSFEVTSLDVVAQAGKELIYHGECKHTPYWRVQDNSEIFKYIKDSTCAWSVRTEKDLEFLKERGSDANQFAKIISDQASPVLGYLSYFKKYQSLSMEIFLQGTMVDKFKYLLDKLIIGDDLKFYFFAAIPNYAIDSDFLEDFYNGSGVVVDDIRFTLRKQINSGAG